MNIKHVAIFIGLLLISGIIFFCRPNENSVAYLKIEAYFPNIITNLIEAEPRKIIADTDKQNILRQAINILYDGPKSKNLSPFSLPNLKLNNLLIDNKTVTINFSSHYNFLEDELFFRSAIVWTLTSLDFVDNIKIYVDDKELKRADGIPIGLLNRTNVIINPEISDEKTYLQVVKLYFRSENKLVPEERLININSNQLIEKYILEQIISGPINSELSATIPTDTKIRDVKTDENICYVSLSEEFASKNNDTDEQEFALYSIVNSLTELENISKVQFLIESEKIQPAWIFDLSKPFERNEKIMHRDKK